MNNWNCARESFLRNTTEPSAAAPCNWNTDFAKCTPITDTFSMDTTPTYWTNLNSLPRSRPLGVGHPHHQCPSFGG